MVMTGGSLWLFYPHYFAFVFCGKVDIKPLMYKLHQTNYSFSLEGGHETPNGSEWFVWMLLAFRIMIDCEAPPPDWSHSENQKTEDLPFGSQHGWRWRSVFPPCFATIKVTVGANKNWWMPQLMVLEVLSNPSKSLGFGTILDCSYYFF